MSGNASEISGLIELRSWRFECISEVLFEGKVIHNTYVTPDGYRLELSSSSPGEPEVHKIIIFSDKSKHDPIDSVCFFLS